MGRFTGDDSPAEWDSLADGESTSAEEDQKLSFESENPDESQAPDREGEHNERLRDKKWGDLEAADLTRGLNASIDRRRKQGRISVDEASEKFAQRRDQIRERASGYDIGKILRSTAAVVIVIGAAFLAVSVQDIRSSEEAAAQDHIAEVEELESELEGVRYEQIDDVEAMEDSAQEAMESARIEADEVAEVQNEFAEIFYSINDQEREVDEESGTSGPFPGEFEAAEHREQMADYFAEQSYLVDESVAYEITAFEQYGSHEIDPRYPWFVLTEPVDEDAEAFDVTFSDPETYQWRTSSVMPQLGTGPDVMRVSWVNESEDGDLLAWALATYDHSEEEMSALTVGFTTHRSADVFSGSTDLHHDDSISDEEMEE